ncbi:hypothetical protein ST47_g2775 [Ascochyta rabiei]|uniref:Uncharacterized protein n=1 Tax=Didymella rabiei TaxID=5454 RepID=A0A163J1U2_DIDRA|nr:hypothetical protein ST47_g2775 [Ascochyta rabiei]
MPCAGPSLSPFAALPTYSGAPSKHSKLEEPQRRDDEHRAVVEARRRIAEGVARREYARAEQHWQKEQRHVPAMQGAERHKR